MPHEKAKPTGLFSAAEDKASRTEGGTYHELVCLPLEKMIMARKMLRYKATQGR